MDRSQIVLNPFLAVSGNTQELEAITLPGKSHILSLLITMELMPLKMQATAGRFANSGIVRKNCQ
jgi:hypothetical protein